MKRRIVLDEPVGDWDHVIDEPRWFSWGAVAAWSARRGLRWLAPRLVVAAVALAGAIWLAIQIAFAVALGLAVFVAVPFAVFALRCVTAAWHDAGGLL